MRRFRKILVVFDDEEQSTPILERAIRLAENNQAHLEIVAVVEETAGRLPGRFLGSPQRDLSARVLEQHRDRLEAFARPARESGLATGVTLLQGIPFLEITREVIRGGHDLVMKSVMPQSAWREMLFSSTDMHLMRKCPAAVWVMKPGFVGHHNRILAAVDPRPDDVDENELHARVMDLAASLARTEHSELNIVHAWTLPNESMLRSPRFSLGDGEVDALAAEARDEHRARLDDLLARYDLSGLDHHVYLLKGLPSQVIPEFAREHQVELIVMGTAPRSRAAGLIMSDTAENILRQVDCSVLAVKPQGFVSPINPAA